MYNNNNNNNSISLRNRYGASPPDDWFPAAAPRFFFYHATHPTIPTAHRRCRYCTTVRRVHLSDHRKRHYRKTRFPRAIVFFKRSSEVVCPQFVFARTSHTCNVVDFGWCACQSAFRVDYTSSSPLNFRQIISSLLVWNSLFHKKLCRAFDVIGLLLNPLRVTPRL